MVARFYEVFKSLKDNYTIFVREIKLTLLPKSNKANISSLPLLSLTF